MASSVPPLSSPVPRRVYLDHAATSWPKPPGVIDACLEYQTNIGVAAGRGAYRNSQRADAVVAEVRGVIAELIGTPHRESIALTSNGTMALNAAILGLLHESRLEQVHVVTTAMEHNSVLRPLTQLQRTRDLNLSIVPCDRDGVVDAHQLELAMRPNTRLVVLNHASNVTGTIMDLAQAVSIAKSHGAAVLVDAAQTLGFVTIDVTALGIDMLAAPLHKGACGMLGTGFLYAHPLICERLRIPWIGGTGHSSDSLNGEYPWRDAVESGNMNVPALASVAAGIRWLKGHQHAIDWDKWLDAVLDTFRTCTRIRLIGPKEHSRRLPVFSLVSETMDCHELAMLVDGARGWEARSGFHCAAMIHQAIDTVRYGGTLRISLGHTTTDSEVAEVCEGLRWLDSL
ncbi:MAG: aminotransferase class V-fold PLP-dependent enzyme [Planctomycetota bacterium]